MRQAIIGTMLAGSLALAAMQPSAPAAPAAADCASGGVDEAARVLVHPQAEVLRVEEVAGVRAAVVGDPLIAPTTRRRLVATGDAWCHADHLGAVLTGSPMAQASAFARLAPTTFYDEVVVLEARQAETVSGATVVELETVAATNGVAATWRVMVDADGVREAVAATTAVGDRRHPAGIQASIEGVTSLPGHELHWTRDGSGRITLELGLDDLLARARADIQSNRAGNGPGDLAVYEASDGFRIELHSYNAPAAVELVPTGQDLVDRHHNFLRYAAENYEAFLDWGLEDRWVRDDGWIAVDDAVSVVCLACATIADAFEVHMSSLMPEIAELVANVEYEDHEEFVHGVIGHEIIHNLQGGYGDGKAGALGIAFIEGFARATEALYEVAPGTHQPNSIMYVDNRNGCNGFEGTLSWADAMASGAFRGHAYDSCHFWLSFLARNGAQRALPMLFQHLPRRAAAAEAGRLDPNEANAQLLAAASPDWGADLAAWGAAAVSHAGWELPAGLGGELLDWARHLEPVEPAVVLGSGDRHAFDELALTGVAVAEIVDAGTVTVRGPAHLVTARNGRLEVRGIPAAGLRVTPTADRRVFVVAVGIDAATNVSVQLR